MKKLFNRFSTVVLAAALLTGCAGNGGSGGNSAQANSTDNPPAAVDSNDSADSGASESESESTALAGTFTHWTYTDTAVFESDEFTKAFPDIKVDLQVFGGDEYENKIRSAMAANTMPDSFDLEEGYVGKYIDVDKIADLKPLGVDEIIGDIYPYLRALGTDSNGVIKGISNNIAPVAFWYNRSTAKEWLGTDDADEIAEMLSSWDKIYAKASEVKEASGGSVWLWPNIGEIPKLMAPSMPYFVQDGKFTFDDKWLEMVHVMRTFWEQDLQGNLGSWSGEWASAWNEGSLIIRVMPSWDFFASDEMKSSGNIGVAKPPYSAFEGATVRCISASASAEKQKMAYEFIKYGISPDFQKANLDEKNQMPCNVKVIAELKGKYSAPTFGGQDIIKTYDEIAQGIPTNIYDIYYRELVNKFGKSASDGIIEGQTDEQIVDNFLKVVRDMFPELGA